MFIFSKLRATVCCLFYVSLSKMSLAKVWLSVFKYSVQLTTWKALILLFNVWVFSGAIGAVLFGLLDNCGCLLLLANSRFLCSFCALVHGKKISFKIGLIIIIIFQNKTPVTICFLSAFFFCSGVPCALCFYSKQMV